MFKPAQNKSFDFYGRYWIKNNYYPINFCNNGICTDLQTGCYFDFVPPFFTALARPINNLE